MGKGEMWHIHKILDFIETPKTQDQLVKVSNLNNFTLKIYLGRLQELGFVENIDMKKHSVRKKGIHHTSAINWEVTEKGRIFKKVIKQYVLLL